MGKALQACQSTAIRMHDSWSRESIAIVDAVGPCCLTALLQNTSCVQSSWSVFPNIRRSSVCTETVRRVSVSLLRSCRLESGDSLGTFAISNQIRRQHDDYRSIIPTPSQPKTCKGPVYLCSCSIRSVYGRDRTSPSLGTHGAILENLPSFALPKWR
jgi:hypothetical protein